MRLARAGAAPLLLVLGAGSGVAAVLLHARWWGLPLAVAAVATTLVALPPGWWSRVPFALGWVAALGWAVVPRPEGDFLLATTVRAYLLLGTGVLVGAWAIGTLPRRAGRAPEPSHSADQG